MSWFLSLFLLDVSLGHFSLLASLFKQYRIILGGTHFSVAPYVSRWVIFQSKLSGFSGQSMEDRSHLLHGDSLMVASRYKLLQVCCRWAAPPSCQCTPNIQPGRTLFTWRGGSWVELQDWRRSRGVSRGSSSADAAQSRSWRRCSWHKIHWLCPGSGALRHKEGWSDEGLHFPLADFICFYSTQCLLIFLWTKWRGLLQTLALHTCWEW